MEILSMGPWGLYDTKDDCWIGNDDGPVTYQEAHMAKLAAQIVNKRFGYSDRIVHKIYEKATKLKDRQTPTLSFVEALDQLEKGR